MKGSCSSVTGRGWGPPGCQARPRPLTGMLSPSCGWGHIGVRIGVSWEDPVLPISRCCPLQYNSSDVLQFRNTLLCCLQLPVALQIFIIWFLSLCHFLSQRCWAKEWQPGLPENSRRATGTCLTRGQGKWKQPGNGHSLMPGALGSPGEYLCCEGRGSPAVGSLLRSSNVWCGKDPTSTKVGERAGPDEREAACL